jgi:hypothetical protein
MSISSIAQDSALRLATPKPAELSLEEIAGTAATTAAAAVTKGTSQETAVEEGKLAAQAAKAEGTPPPTSVSADPLAQLVKYIPTETITIYVAVQAALGEVHTPANGSISDADFGSRWIWLVAILAITLALTAGLSYRAQKDAQAGTKFTWPVFEVLAAGAAFLVWALSLPSTPLRDIRGYNYSAWNSVIILVGTVGIAAAAYVFGKTVSWQKIATPA